MEGSNLYRKKRKLLHNQIFEAQQYLDQKHALLEAQQFDEER